MNRRLEAALSIVLTVCAVLVTALFVYQRTVTRNPAQISRAPKQVKDWKGLSSGRLRIGAESAPVQIVEFADFECPFCKAFESSLQSLIVEMPGTIGVVYYHYPLPMHRFAEAAALAAECGAAAGRFDAMAKELFAKQDSFGLKPWQSYAWSAGVPDTAAFLSCMGSNTTRERIRGDQRLARSLGVSGTPTIVVNGWKFPLPPPPDTLERYVREMIAGRSPFPSR